MIVLVFAARSAPEEAIGKRAREEHLGAEIALIPVKNATQQQLREALQESQPDVAYFADCTHTNTDAGEVKLIDVALGRLWGRPDPRVRHPDALLEEVAATLQSWLGTPDPTDPDGRPTRASMRRVLDRCFPKAASFETFIETDFPDVFRRVTDSMNRIAKTNVLFQISPTRAILAKLAGRPEFEPHRQLLSYELCPSQVWRP